MERMEKLVLGMVSVILVMSLCVSANVIFDENTSGLVFTGDAGTGPDGPVTIIGFSAGSASANLALTAGQTYRIVASRKVITNNNLSFNLDLNGTHYMWDGAWHPLAPDTFQASTYLGYYRPATASTTVTVRDGGPWVARLDYLSFEATADVFFDELTADLTFTGTSGFTPVSGTLSPTPSTNAVGFGPADTVGGTVALAAGTLYNVYASRTVHDTGNLGYDISLGGSFFAHDAAISGILNPNDTTGEALIGQYMVTSAATNVLLSNGGPWAGRVDYLRFEAVPEPATLALLGMGVMALVAKRRK